MSLLVKEEVTQLDNELSYKIIGAAIEVHRILGPGLLESVYEAALCQELILQGLNIKRQCIVEVMYKGIKVKDSLCLDILVENQVIIEVKHAVDNALFRSQLLTYLKLSGLRLGLLINFNNILIRDGITRVVNKL